MSFIRFDHVWFRYNEHWIIEDASLSLKEKDFICIVGPNGGGKSTFLKLLLGLLTPSQGNIFINGLSPHKARAFMGHMPQSLHFDPQFPISVLDVVLMGLKGRIGRGEKEYALSLLKEWDLSAKAHSSFSSLSGGQQQRVLMVRAIISKPKLLILDEPTANLDVEMSKRLMESLKELNKTMTILMVSHDYRFVEETVSKVVCINKTVAIHGTEAITPEHIHHTFHGQVRLIQHSVCVDESHDHSHGYHHHKKGESDE